MYKVFVNEKKLSFTKSPETAGKSIAYEQPSDLEIAMDLLENTSVSSLNVHGDVGRIWAEFSGMFRSIEAAGGVVKNSDQKILFIRRLGKWDLPKGKIEKGESLETAAVREVAEETGLSEVDIEKFITTTYHIYTEKNSTKILKITHWFSMAYFGNQTPKPQIEEGIMEVSWKDQNDIKANVLGKTFKNIELILTDFGFIS